VLLAPLFAARATIEKNRWRSLIRAAAAPSEAFPPPKPNLEPSRPLGRGHAPSRVREEVVWGAFRRKVVRRPIDLMIAFSPDRLVRGSN
jgi:hypothetical protein